jgi:hypothetical protein
MSTDLELALIQYVGDCLTDVMEEPGKKLEVRYSNQPYCPRAYYYASKQPNRPFTVDGSMEAILASGHGLHGALQKRLAARAILNRLENNPNFEFVGNVDPVTGEYIEFEFLHPDRPSGHSDGLIRWYGKYYTLEVKTVALDKLERVRLLPKPYRKNVVQAQCYSYEFTELGYEIEGALIFYVERSRFEQYHGFVIKYEPETGPGYVAMTRYGNECIEKDCLPEGICRSGHEAAYCSFQAECFNARNPVLFYDANFRQLVDLIYPVEATNKKYGGLTKWPKQ